MTLKNSGCEINGWSIKGIFIFSNIFELSILEITFILYYMLGIFLLINILSLRTTFHYKLSRRNT